MNRQDYNYAILDKLQEYITENPDLRFIQALWGMNIVDREDRFHEESKQTLDKVGGYLNITGTLFVEHDKDKIILSVKNDNVTYFNLEKLILQKFENKRVIFQLNLIAKDVRPHINLEGTVINEDNLKIGNDDIIFLLLPYKGENINITIELSSDTKCLVSKNKILQKENEVLKKRLFATIDVTDKLANSEQKYLNLIMKLNDILGEKYNGCSEFSVHHLLKVIENMNREHLNPNLVNDLRNEIQFKNELIKSIVTEKQSKVSKVIQWLKDKIWQRKSKA